MRPDYRKAAEKAIETHRRFKTDISHIDALPILKQLQNVLMIDYTEFGIIGNIGFCCNSTTADDNQDAITLVSRKNGKLKYIIIYSRNCPDAQLELALCRELGHVILEHDGSTPEFVWMEEANCFAHYFLCPLPLLKPATVKIEKQPRIVHYRPKMGNRLWEMKSIQTFSSIDEIRIHVSDEKNRYNRYTESNAPEISPEDIELRKTNDSSDIAGWRNCFDLVLNGETVGYCGE